MSLDINSDTDDDNNDIDDNKIMQQSKILGDALNAHTYLIDIITGYFLPKTKLRISISWHEDLYNLMRCNKNIRILRIVCVFGYG